MDANDLRGRGREPLNRPRASYRDAIDWIARNDDAGAVDVADVRGLLTVALVADVFGAERERVAGDVIRARKRIAREG